MMIYNKKRKKIKKIIDGFLINELFVHFNGFSHLITNVNHFQYLQHCSIKMHDFQNKNKNFTQQLNLNFTLLNI